LATLKDRVFAVYLNYFMTVHTEDEFNILRDSCRPFLHTAIMNLGGEGLPRARKEFNKAGLTILYVEGEIFPFIIIADDQRWAQVSVIYKIREGIPTTTNALESINGHRNEQTPRRNSFWGSINRLSRAIAHGIDSYTSSVARNFNTNIRRALNNARAIGESEMTRQISHYNTNFMNMSCSCGMTSYFTSVFGQFAPCCHLLSRLGGWKIHSSPVLIHSNERYFQVILEKIVRFGPEPSHERRDALADMATRSIKQLSRTGKKIEEIQAWVHDHFPAWEAMVTYVNNIPVVVLEMISSAVIIFGQPPQANP
jgi:hypothetical protein